MNFFLKIYYFINFGNFGFFFGRGSAIAKILGKNVVERKEKFQTDIKMYMYEELVDGRKLTEIVNTEHENVKYLPGIKLPENVVSTYMLCFMNYITTYTVSNFL